MGSFPHYNKEQGIKLIFSYDIPLDIYGNLSSICLLYKNKILHLALTKVTLPRVTNLDHITNKELFLFWIIKNQLDFNFSYFIIKYMIEHGSRVDIKFLLYGIIITQIFAKYKLILINENQTIPPNNSPQSTNTIEIKEGEEHEK